MVTTKIGWVVMICLLGCFFYSVAFGCKYTVRDVGFTDIGSIPYRLYYYIREDTSEDLITTFKQISYVVLMDSSVEVEIINIEQQNDHPSMTYLRFWGIKSFPAAVLVSPKGQSLVLSISAPNKPFKEMVWSALESVVLSPKREEILQHVVKAYCIVLLIQGKDAAENKKAEETVTGAIKEISRMMSQMTKSIEEPPRLIVIPPESFSQEKILLWSIDVNENEMSEPYVAVLYGKGRQIGPLFKGEKIMENSVFNILSAISLACECGSDRRWVLGTTIPLRWGEKVQSEVVKLLGFDAESPMVKTEISQILSIGASFRMEDEKTVESLESTLYGYREEVVEFESKPAAMMVSPAQFQKMNSPEPASSETGSTRSVVSKFSSQYRFSDENKQSGATTTFRITAFIVGGMVLLILAGGVFIILRARRRAS